MYPLTLPGLIVGGLLGTATVILTTSTLGAAAVAMLPIIVGLTWRKHEVPVFPFILTYQWVSVVIGHFFEWFFHPLPYAGYVPGDLDRTVALSLAGLLVLAVGMRIGAGAARQPDDRAEPTTQFASTLFFIVMAVYVIDYVPALNPRSYLGFSAAADAALGFRRVFVLALWYEILSGRGPYRYLYITFIWTLLPSLGSYFSNFKDPVIMLSLVAASFARPWEGLWWRRATPRIIAMVPIAAFVLVVGAAWQTGVKQDVRGSQDVLANAGVSTRASFFIERTQAVVPEIWASPLDAVENLVDRLSYVLFFSRVLEFVPSVEPHANGELLSMAITNAFIPRLLFPDKPPLPSDSSYTNRFTGLRVTEGETSISIGYMAEFYADWGVNGMFASVLCYGLLMGLLHRAIRKFVRTPVMVAPALVTVLISMVEFEHQFVKGFASLNLSFVVVVAALYLLRPWLTRILAADHPGDNLVVVPSTASAADR